MASTSGERTHRRCDDDVETAELGHAVVEGFAESIGIADIDDRGHDLLAGGFDELYGLGEVTGVAES